MSSFLPTVFQRSLDVVRNHRFQPYFVITFTLWLVGAVEIIQKTGGQRLDPRFWMLVAILITAYSGVRIFRLVPPRLNVFRKSSAALNEMLNRICANGFAVYPRSNQPHDGFVVVGPSGVYAMEVKSRKVFGSCTIEYGEQNDLILGGRISDRRPIQQAHAIAGELREMLSRIVENASVIKPLVVFLNDWRINRSGSNQQIPVVSATEVEHFFTSQEQLLTESEIEKISNYLNSPTFATG